MREARRRGWNRVHPHDPKTAQHRRTEAVARKIWIAYYEMKESRGVR